MKRKLLIIAAVVTLILTSIAMVACDLPDAWTYSPDEIPEVTEPTIEVPKLQYYTQEEHITWKRSLKNITSNYPEYFERGYGAFLVPGLKKGQNFVLQGVEFCAEKNWAFLSGYISPKTDNPNSVLFVLDANKTVWLDGGYSYQGALIKEILLDNADGTPFTKHAGGVAVSKNSVWLASDGKLYRIPLSTIESAPATSHIRLDASVNVPVLASYTSFSDGILWVGEFEYARDKYITDKSHHRDEDLTAWTVGYKLAENGEDGYDPATGIKSTALGGDVAIPDCVLWHGSKIQGFAVAGNRIVMSSSYGRRNDSSLMIYTNPIHEKTKLQVVIGGAYVPTYLLTDYATVSAPPMTEDLSAVYEGGSYYVLVASESSSHQYYGAESSVAKNPVDFVWKFKI